MMSNTAPTTEVVKMLPQWELTALKFQPQRLSYDVFTYRQAVSHPVLLGGGLFLFPVKMKRSKRRKTGLERERDEENFR